MYCIINLDAMRTASRALSSGAFRLWCFYASNQNGYTFATGNSIVFDTMGMKRDAYDRATGELIREGFLVQEQGNRYAFHERPVMGIPGNVANNLDGDTSISPAGKSTFTQREKASGNNIPVQNNNTSWKNHVPIKESPHEAVDGLLAGFVF